MLNNLLSVYSPLVKKKKKCNFDSSIFDFSWKAIA